MDTEHRPHLILTTLRGSVCAIEPCRGTSLRCATNGRGEGTKAVIIVLSLGKVPFVTFCSDSRRPSLFSIERRIVIFDLAFYVIVFSIYTETLQDTMS